MGHRFGFKTAPEKFVNRSINSPAFAILGAIGISSCNMGFNFAGRSSIEGNWGMDWNEQFEKFHQEEERKV